MGGRDSGPGRAAGGQMSLGKDLSSRLHEVIGSVAQARPLPVVAEATLASARSVLGPCKVVFSVHSKELATAHPGLAGPAGPTEPPRLREGDRVSPNGFFTRAEALLRSSSGEHVSDDGGWREDDALTIVLRSGSGRPVASVIVSDIESGRLPSLSEVEAVDLLSQVLRLAAVREQDLLERRETSSGLGRRSDLLEDILRIASSVVSERDLNKVSEMVLSSVSSLFGFRKVTLVVYDEAAAAFKWAALFGYPEQTSRQARLRAIPMEVVLEDLRESRRIGKTVYFTPLEDVSQRSAEYFVEPVKAGDAAPVAKRQEGEFRKGDALAFALHDSTGRVVGVIYPADPRDGRLPDKETLDMVEVFTYLAEVAIENARLSHDREQALRLSSLRMEQMSRIFDITSNILYIRDLDELIEDVLRSLAQLLGIKRMVMALRTDDGRMFKVRGVYGYTEERAEEVRKTEYPYESVDEIIHPEKRKGLSKVVKWSKKVGSMTYYLPAESVNLEPWELSYYPEPELLRLPRKSRDHWHELDYMDTYIRDSQGEVVAYIEILRPRDDRIPDQETVEVIEIFASLVGVALENARMVQGHVESRRGAEFYTDLLSHDIKNFNQAIMGYLDLLKAGMTRPEQLTYIDKVNEQVMNINRLSADVRTMSRLAWGGSKLAQVDLGKVLLDSVAGVQQYYLGRRVEVRHSIGVGTYRTNADDLIRELFINILTNAVKYDPNPLVEIDLTVEKVPVKHGSMLVVSVADRGRGVPDDLKEEIFERFNRAPKKKGTGLGLHIVKTLTSRYHGRVWVEDRVEGDHTQGAVFKVELPSAD